MLLSLLFFIGNTYGQVTKSSVLKKLPTLSNDSNKVLFILNAIGELHQENPSFALGLAKQSLQISTKINYKNGQKRSLNNIGILYNYLGYGDSSVFAFKKKYALFNDANDCIDVANAYYLISNYDSASKYIDKILLAKNLHITNNTLARCYMLKGLILGDQGKQAQSIKSIQHAIDFFELDSNYTKISNCYYNIGVAFEEMDDSLDFIKAEYYMRKSISLLEKVDSSSPFLIPKKNGLATFLLKVKKPKEALKLSREIINTKVIIAEIEKSRCYLNMSDALFNLGRMDSVLYYLNLSETLSLNYGDNIHLSDIHAMKAHYYQAVGKHKIAKQEITKALQYDPEKSSTYFYNIVIDVAESLHDYPLANQYLKKIIILKDSSLSKEVNKQMIEMTEKYESEKKEAKISLLQKDMKNKELINKLQTAEIKTKENENKNQLLIIILLGLIITGSIALTIFIKKRKEYRISQLEKEKELEATIYQLKGQDEERSRISRELHDGIANEVLAIKMKYDSNPAIAQELKTIHNNIRDLSHQLAETQVIDRNLDDVIRELIKSVLLANNLTVYYLWFPVNDFIKLDADKTKNTYRILQEIFSNIVKHADASNVDINATKYDDMINITVTDNGKGFDLEKSKNGLGLENIKERVKALKGTIIIDSNLTRGTTILIDLPIP